MRRPHTSEYDSVRALIGCRAGLALRPFGFRAARLHRVGLKHSKESRAPARRSVRGAAWPVRQGPFPEEVLGSTSIRRLIP